VTDIPIARPSSTVVLARDSRTLPELFMVRRHANSSYGGAYVFPGGVVDKTDGDVRAYCHGLESVDADRLLAVESGGLDYYIAAIRELFEETGVLLAEHGVPENDLHRQRRQLNSSALDWHRFVADNEVRLRCDVLHYFSHWITPDVYPKRYTTRFFVARAPEGQIARHDEGELTDAIWITAKDALSAASSGDLSLHFPTIKTLERAAEHDSVNAIVDWADELANNGVAAIHPVMPGGDPGGVPQIHGAPKATQ